MVIDPSWAVEVSCGWVVRRSEEESKSGDDGEEDGGYCTCRVG